MLQSAIKRNAAVDCVQEPAEESASACKALNESCCSIREANVGHASSMSILSVAM